MMDGIMTMHDDVVAAAKDNDGDNDDTWWRL